MTTKQEPTSLLGRWYAAPLTREEASALLTAADARRTERLRRGSSCHVCRLQQMVAHFWLGKEIDDEFRALQLLVRNTAHGSILAELIYGQLLMSQRRDGAMAALDHAFYSARHLLTSGDYFVLFNRHGRLRLLPVGALPLKSLSLTDLLTTASVIERLTASLRVGERRDKGRSI